MLSLLVKLLFNNEPSSTQKNAADTLKEKKVTANLRHTLQTFENLYYYPVNNDVKIRHLQISEKKTDAALLFINTIIKKETVETAILRPLLEHRSDANKINEVITDYSVTTEQQISNIVQAINNGSVALFIHGASEAYIINAADFKGRPIEKPENEITLKGPKESFNETVQSNISLIRKKIRNENLTVESTVVSKRSGNEVKILYVRNLVNDALLSEIKGRLNNIDVASIRNLSILEQYIEDRKRSIFSTLLNTERPDVTAEYLLDGYIVLLMDNSPDSLILPATFWSFFHDAEDRYLRFVNGNFTRIIRMLAMFITLFISAIYVAITQFHIEMLPPSLLLAVATTRELVPFPPIIEILLMEIAFELIREAGLRVPSPIGPTIGIVGALILGQAAVEANIVSPIVVIVVALSGLSSFAIGNLSLNFAMRLTRFFIILSAALFGIYGVVSLFTIGIFYLVSIKSFGVPYFSPLAPRYKASNDTYFRSLLTNEIFRPGYLKPKDIKKSR
ncbi:spore germination protein [Virgibacillus sp. W0430]|uniref:spore germination protein n=1 Tax=Virgibacillus sp. W0430 TaxID=3391580 RepID=UPI003F4863EB